MQDHQTMQYQSAPQRGVLDFEIATSVNITTKQCSGGGGGLITNKQGLNFTETFLASEADFKTHE